MYHLHINRQNQFSGSAFLNKIYPPLLDHNRSVDYPGIYIQDIFANQTYKEEHALSINKSSYSYSVSLS